MQDYLLELILNLNYPDVVRNKAVIFYNVKNMYYKYATMNNFNRNILNYKLNNPASGLTPAILQQSRI